MPKSPRAKKPAAAQTPRGPKGGWTLRKDQADDRKRGIKPGSKTDNALDRKRGVPTQPA